LLSFFFSSRRRHTRCYRDWSSDVCSSDLALLAHFTAIARATAGTEPAEALRAARRHEVVSRAVDELERNGSPALVLEAMVARMKIGRASCRERGEDAVGGGE